jgi:hypothetical protein
MADRSFVALFVLAVLCGCAALDAGEGATEANGGQTTVSEDEMSAEDRGAAEPRPAASVRKKGVGHWGRGDDRLAPRILDELGCGWYYNWGPRPVAGEEKVEAEFVPMVWDDGHVTDEILEALKEGGHSALLGFNEPDSKGQANVSVARAIELWPKLMETGLRLGSPGTTQGNRWLDEFMEEAIRRDYRVDFICLHWYGDITKPDAVGDLRRYLTQYWEKYQRPLWLTEFSGADWEWCTRRPVTFEDNARFARESIAMLESLPFVERYAWWSAKANPSNRYYPTTGLYWTADEITEVGVAYRDGDRMRDENVR